MPEISESAFSAVLSELKLISSLLSDVRDELRTLRQIEERQTQDYQRAAAMPARMRG